MKIEIITIGDEILIGQIVDTNSAWMGTELNKLGWEVVRITTIADKKEDTMRAFDAAFERADVVLVTGGTGPTKDDLTKNVLMEYFGGKELVFHPEIIENIRGIFAQRSKPVNELTQTQAWIPDNCNYIMNKVGTAPCLWYEKNGKVLFSMPGVPYEMKWVMQNGVMPLLEQRYSDGQAAAHHHFLVMNYSESGLAEFLADYEKQMPASFKLAYLPHPGIVKLRLTGRNHDKALLERQMGDCVLRMREVLGKNIFAEEDLPLGELVGKALAKRNYTLSTAESCTGGYIATLITAVPGCSSYYKGSVVSYSNEVKHNVLGVKLSDLEESGAVSEPVVRAMAEGVCRVCGTDCAVATSGIAGPDGGTSEKPVGTVWIAAKCGEKLISRKYEYGKLREYNIHKASNAALLMLLELLNE